jgi:hypothetical protein
MTEMVLFGVRLKAASGNGDEIVHVHPSGFKANKPVENKPKRKVLLRFLKERKQKRKNKRFLFGKGR